MIGGTCRVSPRIKAPYTAVKKENNVHLPAVL